MTYVLRQLFDALLSPLVCAVLILVVAGLLWTRGRQRSAATCGAVALLLLYCASLLPVGDALLSPLENRFPPLESVHPLPRVDDVVVLGSSYTPRDGVSVVAALDEDGLVRAVEGVRIARKLGAARLILSGGAPQGRTPSAVGYARLARELGVDEKALVVLDQSLNTDDEARAIAALLGSKPFVLVTSASHMPRAVYLMHRHGAQPIPAPTMQRAGATYAHVWNYLVPSSTGLRHTERALHEYVGRLTAALGMG